MSESAAKKLMISGRTVVSKQGAAIRVTRLELSSRGREAIRSESTGLFTRAEKARIDDDQRKKLKAA